MHHPSRPTRRPLAALAPLWLLRRAMALLVALAVAVGAGPFALFGMAAPAYAAGDLTVRLYQDLDRDGEFDLGEQFAPGGSPNGGGIPVAVYNADNTLVQLANTLPGGTIAFASIPSSAPGQPYRVEVVPAALGVVSRFGNPPPDRPNSLVSFVTLADGASVTVEVGLRLHGALGGVAGRRSLVTRVWDDRDGNGIQDAGEPGLPGVTLGAIDTVSGAPIAGIPDTTTNADGYAVFDDSIPADTSLSLRVLGGVPAGYVLTRQAVDDGQFTPVGQRDSDAFRRGGGGPVELLVPAAPAGRNDDSLDIGFAQGALSGGVFRDRDAAKDGRYNAGIDAQLNGVTVELYNASDELVGVQQTRQASPTLAGFFEFGGLPLADSPYRLVIPGAEFDTDADPLFGAASSPGSAGGDQGLVNGTADTAIVSPGDTVQIATIELDATSPGISNLSAANLFGFYQGTLGDLVALDADRDGTVDPEEASLGIPGVLVFVDDGRGGGLAGNGLRDGGELVTTTDANGRYRFDDLPLGPSYSVAIDRNNFAPGGILEGLGGTNATFAPSGSLVRTAPALALAPDDDNLAVDFGIRGADVGNVVWEDLDGDGLYDLPSESGVAGVAVRIFRATTPPVQVGAAQITSGTGTYTIPELLAGSYYVQFDLRAGSLDGFYGSPLAPAGYAGVNPTDGALSQNDLAFAGDLATFHADRLYSSREFSIAPGSDNPGVDAALYRPVSLAGLAFYDEDGDELNGADPADPGVPGLAVLARHLGPDGLPSADDFSFDGGLTDATGAYDFDAARLIPPGLLRVELLNPDTRSFRFVTADAGTPPDSNDASDSDVVGSFAAGSDTYGVTAAVVRTSGEAIANLDAGYTGKGTLSGSAFEDGTADGLLDTTGDSPLDGTEVALSHSFALGAGDFTLTRSATTAGDGSYSFGDLPAGTFSLSFTPPATYVPTFADEADGTDADSDGLSASDGLAAQTLAGGANERRDAGFYRYVGASGRVFFDATPAVPDGLGNAPDPGMAQIAIQLLNLGADNAVGGAGADEDLLVTALTDTNGGYQLDPGDELRPGNLRFAAINPRADSFGFVPQDAGDDAVDSDVSPISGQAGLTLLSGATAANLGAGFIGARQVAADAFVDADGNGRNDDGAPLGGVAVTMEFSAEALPWLARTSLPTRSGVTAGDGSYVFAGLPAGSFSLSFTPPAEAPAWAPTFPDVGDPSLLDSDGASPEDGLADQTLAGADEARSQGFVKPVSVSGEVWFDNDDDGLRDGGEGVLTGATVEVIGLGPDGAPGGGDDLIDTLTTDGSGAYSTDGVPALPPGRLVVRLPNPSAADYAYVLAGADSDLRSATGAPPTAAQTAPFDLPSAGSAAGVDVGLRGARAIAGFAFVDANGDGRSGGDSMLPGATVSLAHAVDLTTGGANLTTTITRSATTDGSGYRFAGLPGSGAGSFDLSFAPPAASPAWQATALDVNANGNDADDSDGPAIAGQQLSAAEARYDQGYFAGASVGGLVWFDTDGDGTRDAGEPPLTGVALELIALGPDATLGTPDDGAPVALVSDGPGPTAGQYTTTAGSVRPGLYVVRVANPDVASFAFRTTGANNDIRSTNAPLSADRGWTAPFVVSSGAASLDHDAGLSGAGTLKGLAFEDLDGQGQNDAGDPALPGVGVALTLDVALPSLSGSFSYSALTDGDGRYSFPLLPAGTINSLAFTAPGAAWQPTAGNVGPDASDSDGPALAGIPFAAGTTAAVYDQGYYRAATITVRVFDEVVAIDNGFQQGEAGLAGVTVTRSNPSSSVVSAADGTVTFVLAPGTYIFSRPAPGGGFSPSPANSGDITLSVTSGHVAEVPFGYYRPATLRGSAWFDSDGDGLQGASEPGMQGRNVTLVDQNGATMLATSTTITGSYTLAGVLPAGPGLPITGYSLCFDLPAGFTYTVKGASQGADGNSDLHSGGPGAGCSDPFTMLRSGVTVGTIDGGYVGTGSIGDLVWNDADNDGLQDPDEDGLAGAVVTLELNTAGAINASSPTIVLSATSTLSDDLAGNYTVVGVPPLVGLRVVSVMPPVGFVPTPANRGGDEAADGDAAGDSFGALAPGATEARLDFGFAAVTTVGDLVWLDLNGNGLYDAGAEAGVPGLQVQLRSGSTVISTTTTGGGAQAGRYAFTDLAPGSYSLRFVAPAGYSFVDDGAGDLATDGDNDARADGTTPIFSLGGGQRLTSVDAGLRGTSGLAGLVWVDENRNDLRDQHEVERLAGVEVTLALTPTLAPERVFTATALTGADGSYSFAGLPAGAATVRFARPDGLFPVAANAGPDTSDSDGPVAALDLPAGVSVASVDMGYRERGALVFLPLVIGRPALAELTGSFAVTPASPQGYRPAVVEVTVTNRGEAPASNFWVDLYINPARRPTVNDRWNDLCGDSVRPCQGLAWYYRGTLAPGQSVILTSAATSDSDPRGYERAASVWGGSFVNGTRTLALYVDSWNRDAAGAVRDLNGAVLEANEGNNLAEAAITVPDGLPPELGQLVEGELLERSSLRP